MKFLKNIVVGCFVILMIDGCVYRDPRVVLSHGYEILAISPSSPCGLQYASWRDDRPYSDYTAMRSTDSSSNATRFSLVSDSEILQFDDEAEWLGAIQEFNAAPDSSGLGLEGVESFAADENHVIGTYAAGHFVLDIQANRLVTFADETKWSSSVSQETDLSSDVLHDPKSPLAQSRHPIVVVAYAVLLIGAVVSSRRDHASQPA